MGWGWGGGGGGGERERERERKGERIRNCEPYSLSPTLHPHSLAVSSAQSRAAILGVATTKCGEAGRNVFATCGADGTLRLHHMLEENPLVELPLSDGYLLDVQWSHSRSAVFASAGEDGKVWFFDLAREQVRVAAALAIEEMCTLLSSELCFPHAPFTLAPSFFPQQGLFSPCDVLDVAADAGSDAAGRAVHSIAFNPSESNASLFAAGDAGGNVLVYELPTDLALSDAVADEEAVARLERAGRE